MARVTLLLASGPGSRTVGFRSLDLGTLALQLVVLLFSLSYHERAHAWAANKLGDPTARLRGRLTLNPIAHVDPFGTLLLPLLAALTGLMVIGWALPVPVDTSKLRRPRFDHALIAAAGPASNLLLALAAAFILRVVLSIGGAEALAGLRPALLLLVLTVQINVLLVVFNLIPVPPLDGSWILSGFLPAGSARLYDRLRPYGILLLYGLILSPAWSGWVSPAVVRATSILLAA